MRKNLLFMALFCLVIPFVSCSKSDSDSEDEYEYEGSGNGKTESILIGKWTPYTWDSDDYSFLEDVGWLEIKKNHTYEMYGYDRALSYSGDWELIKDEKNENKIVVLKILKIGETFLDEMSTGSPYTKEQVKSVIIGTRMYMEIEDIFSNYMRTVKFSATYNNGETETVVTRIEWRK